jgi:N-acetylglucosamine kinase-like BadF-type ATPase
VRRAAILAVDGGGSKVDAVLLRRSGEVIAARRVPARG